MKLPFTLVFSLVAHLLPGQLPSGFANYEIAGGLNPTDLAISADGRVFLTEKDGLVRIVQNGALLTDPFVILQVEAFNEQGLGHIALHPDFPNTPYVYLYYTVPDSIGLSHNRLVRVTADGNLAVAGSDTILYECDPSFGTVHQGGDIAFGNDGKIYLSTGDKGRGDKVQSLDSDLGKVLRINADGTIPADNPYYHEALGKYRAIYALGLRNPFSMAVQTESGKIFVSDVGAASWEEINQILPGKNYGWPLVEGKALNQQTPANYMDPLYAYDHNTGCAVIGAGFYPTTEGNFPAVYKGMFFFADYCKGDINMMEPSGNHAVGMFASGINRPVAIAISPKGEFYFLARAGIGGGSTSDNTESENGSLWKIVYTGSPAPFIYYHPKGDLIVTGEDYNLTTLALGKPPLHYRWQKNGLDYACPDSNTLTIIHVTLADSNTAYRCIVTNSTGADTSKTAVLLVTDNQRPIPTIVLPALNTLYKAGREIEFSGHAEDPETGVIAPIHTYWKIDFHHNDHLHPVMTPTPGITDETIQVPVVGEPSDNVWYRFHFSAVDPAGLTGSVYRDVFPVKTPVRVESNQSGIPVDADGFYGKTPYHFLSVAGLQRSLRVPTYEELTDTVLMFHAWENGLTNQLRSFITPDSGTFEARADFEAYPKANGFGLLGQYFRESDGNWTFDEPLLYSRIDSTINFEWQEGSPQPGYIPIDGFCTRWTGQLVPYCDDLYTFYLATDDGSRLWIGDSLLIDEWHGQPAVEHTATIWLKGGKRYPFKLEYLELGGAATAILKWSTARMPKETIPQRQFYPPQALIPNQMSGNVWLDTDFDGVFDPQEVPLPNTALLLLDSITHLPVASGLTDSTGHYTLKNIPSGTFQAYLAPSTALGSAVPGPGLDARGYSDYFALTGEANLQQNFTFQPGSQRVPWADRAWRISPNPGNGLFVFTKMLVSYHEKFTIRVFDAKGRLCLATEIPEDVWEKQLDLREFPAGIYWVRAGNRVEKLGVF